VAANKAMQTDGRFAAAADRRSVPGGCAAGNRGADCVKLLAPALAPEQGARPGTVNRTIKLRLLARPPVPVSTAIIWPEVAGTM